jgi:hypothetical protein
VDFPYLLYADQLALPTPDGLRAAPGVSWIRLATDLPTAAIELAHGRIGWRKYFDSLRAISTESVFSRDDLVPALAELALLPYLGMTRGWRLGGGSNQQPERDLHAPRRPVDWRRPVGGQSYRVQERV